MEAMMRWSWPGNIRELENFIERSVILSEGGRLTVPRGELREGISRQPSDSDGTLRDKEREHIIEILRQTRCIETSATTAPRFGLIHEDVRPFEECVSGILKKYLGATPSALGKTYGEFLIPC
jgi:transcriptional regulator with GAF, ATPase, and Fis domain